MNPDQNDRRPRLTRFLTQELLFEYISGSLHPSRHRLVEEHLESDRESQRELLNLSKGLEYAHEIGRLHVSPALRDALLNFEPQWKKRLRAWTLWSSRRGWRVLPYAFSGLAVTLTLAVTKPWRRVAPTQVELAEHVHLEPRSNELVPARVIASATGSSGISAVVGVVVSPATNVGANPTNVAAAPAVQPPPSAAQTTPAPTPVPPPTEAAVDPSDVPVETGGSKPLPKGTLLRGEIAVGQFTKSWPAIKAKIIALKGKAAGNVELGWLRRRDQSYFHFSIPESNRAAFERYLSTFGRVQIKPEASPRVMPDGHIRIILTVKDGGSTNEGQTKAP